MSRVPLTWLFSCLCLMASAQVRLGINAGVSPRFTALGAGVRATPLEISYAFSPHFDAGAYFTTGADYRTRLLSLNSTARGYVGYGAQARYFFGTNEWLQPYLGLRVGQRRGKMVSVQATSTNDEILVDEVRIEAMPMAGLKMKFLNVFLGFQRGVSINAGLLFTFGRKPFTPTNQ